MLSTKKKDQFYNMVDSLKKARRADLSDINSDDKIIEKLYVDALESEFVLKSCLKPNTSILIGRKGTGKSTIIARIQHEIRKSKNKLSLYLDVKTIFEQSKVSTYDTSQYEGLMASDDLQSYLLYKNFLKQIIQQIKEEVRVNTFNYYLKKISKVFGGDNNNLEFTTKLEQIFSNIDERESPYVRLVVPPKIYKQMGQRGLNKWHTKQNAKKQY